MNKLLIYIGLFVFSVVGAATAKNMSLEDISKVKSVRSLQISPDGQWLAFTKSKPRVPYQDEDGSAWSELYVLSATESAAKARPFISGKVSIGAIQWAADSSKIYYLAKRGDDKHTSLYAIPIDGGESQAVTSFKTSIGSYSINHDASKAIFIAKDEKPKHVKKLTKKGFKAKVYEEDVQKNQLWVLDLNDSDAKAEAVELERHITSASFNPVNNLVLVQTAPTSLIDDVLMEKQLQVIDLKGKVKKTFETKGKQGKAIWSSDGQQVAFIGANDFNDPTAGALYVANLKSGQVNKKKGNLDSHVMNMVWNGDDIYYIEHKDAESRVVKTAVKRRIADQVLTEYGQGIQTSISVSQNGSVATLTNKANHPSEVYLANKRLTDSNPWLADISLGKQVVYNYKAEDGLDLQGVLVYPVNYKKGKRYPMIAFVHGGPESHRSNGWNTRYADPIQVAAGEGYFSFIPNYRGSTGRGDKFARLDQHGYADPEFMDIVDGKLSLVKQGLVNADKVGITGGSYGGFATAWSATALSEHYAAGVMFVGISNQLSKFGTTDIPNEMHAVHARAWPWDDFQWMLERSPIYHVKKSKTPLLIMHGENDTRVHPSQSMELYRYLKTIDQAPVRLVLYPGEGHGNRKAAAQLDYSMRLMRWMNHYLKGKGGQPPAYDLKHQEKLEKSKD